MKRTIKGFIALLLTLTMLCAVPVTGFAVGDSIKNAESIELNSAHSGTLKNRVIITITVLRSKAPAG